MSTTYFHIFPFLLQQTCCHIINKSCADVDFECVALTQNRAFGAIFIRNFVKSIYIYLHPKLQFHFKFMYMKRLKEKAYLEPECKVTEIKTDAVLCASDINQSGIINDPFAGATEILW